MGSQMGDASSIEYLDSKGMDYVTCQSTVIPATKITAAQAHIRALASKLMEDSESESL
jgi:hypothetical protein